MDNSLLAVRDRNHKYIVERKIPDMEEQEQKETRQQDDQESRGGTAVKPERLNKLEAGNIWHLIVSMAIPSIIAQLVGILYNMVDRMFIGRIENGTMAMAALSVSLPLITCITAFTRLVGIGGAPACAIKMGQKDQEGAEEIIGVSFASLIFTGFILTVLILIFQKPVLTLFGADAATLPMACDYITIYALGTIFVMIALGMNSYITSQGFARTGMFTVLIGAILNIFFDAVFINVLGWGVKGAAVATIIAQGISCVWALAFLFGKKSLLRIRWKNFRVKWKVLLPIMSLGVSPFTMSMTESLIQISFNNQLGKYGGTMAVGTVAIMFSLWQFITLPTQGICQGAQPIISYNYGAQNYSRVRKACRISLALCMVYSSGITLCMMGFARSFSAIFSNDPLLLHLSAWVLPIYSAGGLVFGAQTSCQQSFMALGQAKISLLLACLRKVILLTPLIYIFPATIARMPIAARVSEAIAEFAEYPAEVFAVFLAEPVSDTLAAVCTTIVFYTFYRKNLMGPDKPREAAV